MIASGETDPFPSLVDVAWLSARLEDPDLRVLDCTVWLFPAPSGVGQTAKSGREDWEAGHIPGSIFADLLNDLAEPHPRCRCMLPSAEKFAAAMGRLGVGDGARVVLYDRDQGGWAARLWQMLRAFGFERTGVLDGGWKAWKAGGFPISTEPCRYPSAHFTARPRAGYFVDRAGMQAALGDPKTVVINALRREQHAGTGGIHYGRKGHIPGTKNVPYREFPNAATDRLPPLDTLRAAFAPTGALTADRVVTYCGAGIAASGDAFALHLLGMNNVAVYDASLEEWAADPNLPMTTG